MTGFVLVSIPDTVDGVFLSVVSRVEEVVRGLLEGGQHQDGLLHLGQAVSGYAQVWPLTQYFFLFPFRKKIIYLPGWRANQ